MINKIVPFVMYQYNVGSFPVIQSENESYVQSLERKFSKAEYGVFFLKYFMKITVLSISIKNGELFYNYSETKHDDWDARAPMTYHCEISYSEVMNLIKHNKNLDTFWQQVESIKSAEKILNERYNISEKDALEAYDKYKQYED